MSMKFKSIIATSLIAFSCSSFAEEYIFVSEAEDGTKLILDAESVIVKKNDADKVTYVAGMFLYPLPKVETVPFVITVPVKDCDKGIGALYHLEKSEKTWKLIEKQNWSAKGTTMYDHAAIVLCAIRQEKIKGISI